MGRAFQSGESGGTLKGWNLIGNPFGMVRSLGDKPFYRMNDLGTEIIASVTNTVEATAGVYVLRLVDGDTVRTQKIVIDNL